MNRFVRFVDSYGIRGLLFETLLANPKLLELFVRLFDSSAIFSDIVIRRPQLIEEVTRGKTLTKRSPSSGFWKGSENDEDLPPLEWVRAFRRSEVVRILLRDILHIASQEELELEMTQLAEACLEYCAGNSRSQKTSRYSRSVNLAGVNFSMGRIWMWCSSETTSRPARN